MLMRETSELLLGADEDQDLADAGDGDDAPDGGVDDGDGGDVDDGDRE